MSKVTRSLKILSFNIHKGFSSGNVAFTLEATREAVRTQNADLVFLQEVTGENSLHKKNIKQWPSESQFEYLADGIWHHHAYGKNAVYEEGHHGNALLSKYPIVEYSNHDISTHLLESRGILHSVIEIPGWARPLHCLCIHLGLTGRGRRLQLKKICNRVNDVIPKDLPLIVAGDFNDWSLIASRILEREIETKEVFLSAKGKHVRTFPSAMPMLSLDRIYYRGFHVTQAEVLTSSRWRKLSDHAALYAVLRYEGE